MNNAFDAAATAWRDLPATATVTTWRYYSHAGDERPYRTLVLSNAGRMLAGVQVRNMARQ
jgi:hypothetical protein